jgi:hypothetical protein
LQEFPPCRCADALQERANIVTLQQYFDGYGIAYETYYKPGKPDRLNLIGEREFSTLHLFKL